MLKTASSIPFPFILDELSPLRLTIKRAFGFTYLYFDDVLLCCLRESAQRPNSNGLWLFTTREHVDSLGAEFPGLPRRQLWRSGNNAWVVLASSLEQFEEHAFKACELILSRDGRIGRLSRAKIRQSQPPQRDYY